MAADIKKDPKDKPVPEPSPDTGSAPAAADESSDKEEIYFEGRVPTRAFLCMHGVFYVLLLGWNFGLIWAWLRSQSWKVMISNQRLVVTRGWISQREEDIPLYRATDCGFEQSVFGRIFHTGVITLISDDKTSPTLTFPMPEPKKYKELLRESTHRERKRMRSMDLS